MSLLAALPAPDATRVYGWGKARIVRELWKERCSVDEITLHLHVTRQFVSQALRKKAGVVIWPGSKGRADG